MQEQASTTREIKINLEGIGHVLSDRLIAVPAHQRSFAWEDRQVLDFFTDIDQSIKDGADEYFMGSIVLISDKVASGRPQLVDGQQRLAVAIILLAAVRDYFAIADDSQRADAIEAKYLFNRDVRTLDLIPRLKLNEIDHDFFIKKVLSKPDSPEREVITTKESHKRIANAAKLAREHIRTLSSETKDSTASIMDLVEYLDKKVNIIYVDVPDHSNAFRIFETLNDRGLDLAISDLLKNYLFHQSGNRIEETKERWISMLGTLELVGGEEITVQYVRHFWSSRHGLTRERDLYDSIKKEVASKQSSITFVTELAENAKIYSGIINTDQDIWDIYGQTSKDHMKTLNVMGMIQIRPLLLSILKSFEVKEIKNSMALFVSWAVRFLIVGGLGGGTLENHYSILAKDISDGKIKNTKQLKAALHTIVPTDIVFQQAFSTCRVTKQALARYYLVTLQKQSNSSYGSELVPNTDIDQVNLEHILPQTPSDAWGSIDLEAAKSLYKRLGNMTLLKSKLNSSMGNKGFSQKKEEYEKSQFSLTKQVAQYSKWDEVEINERQKKLAELALKTWPI